MQSVAGTASGRERAVGDQLERQFTHCVWEYGASHDSDSQTFDWPERGDSRQFHLQSRPDGNAIDHRTRLRGPALQT